MAKTFVWDLGFDFNEVQKSDTLSYLQNGLVLIQSSDKGNVPATPVNLVQGDFVKFNAFNVTDPSTGDYEIAGGEITFKSASTTQAAASPFNNPDGSFQTKIQIAPQAPTTIKGASIIFGGTQAPDALTPDQPTFPKWPLVSPQTVANNGRFLMTAALIVKGPSGLPRTFVVDPEMIVGGIG
jgi:hypothetical protein